MILSDFDSTENIYGEAFESGYLNAATSLGRMLNKTVGYNRFYHASHLLDSLNHDGFYPDHGAGNYTLITTEIFGDIFGKSYLLLSKSDYEELTRNIMLKKDSPINFHHEFLKEVDNILSASVISKLANMLKVKIYGDIPIWKGEISSAISELISTDFRTRTDKIYLNTIFFSFDNSPEIKPLFIWAMDARVVEMQEERKQLQ